MVAEPKPWPRLSSRLELKTRIFELRTDTVLHPLTGGEHHFHVLESPDWVNVVAVTAAREMVLIRQYRHGTKEITLEIPGGLIEPGDTPQEAALRELREETGFGPGRVRQIGWVRPNPAFLDNTCYTFIVEEAVPIGPPCLEADEDISVELRPIGDFKTLIDQGQITHSLVLNAFLWFWLDQGLAL